MKLLIVDDHAGMRSLIRELARPVATEIRECASGESAVDVCASYAPDAVTMDLRMGAMSGLAAAKEILALHPASRVLVVTQFDHPRLRALAVAAGVEAFICKDDLPAVQKYLRDMVTDSAPTP